jgi:hypothetical protein
VVSLRSVFSIKIFEITFLILSTMQSYFMLDKNGTRRKAQGENLMV